MRVSSVWLLASVLLLGCEDAASSSSSVGGGSSSSGAGAGNSVFALPTCVRSCDSVADCSEATTLANEDNWSCDGTCQYLGCVDDAECQEAIGPLYVCDTSAAGVPTCAATCAAVADCVTANSAAFDEDNWTCAAGRCEYLGCVDDEECFMTFFSPSYACVAAGATKQCQPTCATPEDCATDTTTTNADNWACSGGVCEYLGCNNDTECVSALMDNGAICAE